MKCGLAFDVSVYHHGKDAPAVLGEVTKHYYDHPSVQVVHLLDKAKAEARRKAFKLAADEMEKWASELPLDGCEGAPEGLDQHSFSRGTVEMGKLLQREANEFAARLRAMGESQ